VLMLMKDTPDLVAAYLGVMRSGAASCSLNTRLVGADIAYIMQDSGAPLILVDRDFLPLVESLKSQVNPFPRVEVRDGPGEGFASFLAGQPETRQSADMRPDELCLLSYTSGTTGKPKGVEHMHGSIEPGERHTRWMSVKGGDRVFSTSKLFFTYAIACGMMGTLMVGATMILNEDWPDAAIVAAIVEREKPDIVYSVPSMYQRILSDGFAGKDCFKKVRAYVSAGERLPEGVCRNWMDATGSLLLEGIGTTEVLFLFITTTPSALKPGYCGKPVPWVKVKVTDGEGNAIATPNESGTLWVQMPSVFKGYRNKPELTAAVFKDGWWRTGDVFAFDEDGWWYTPGRADDMLKISGQWVSPTEVEEVAMTVPGILEAAAVGAPNKDGLIRLTLFAVADPAEPLEALEQRVVETLRQNLAIYKCPRHVRFIEAMPRTPTGKMQRFKLRERLVAEASS